MGSIGDLRRGESDFCRICRRGLKRQSYNLTKAKVGHDPRPRRRFLETSGPTPPTVSSMDLLRSRCT